MSSTGKRNQQRGSEFEREAVKALHKQGFLTARRTGNIQSNGKGDPDIAGLLGLWGSCKRWKRKSKPTTWWEDADARCPPDQRPILISRGDGRPAVFSCRLDDLEFVIQHLVDAHEIAKRLHP